MTVVIDLAAGEMRVAGSVLGGVRDASEHGLGALAVGDQGVVAPVTFGQRAQLCALHPEPRALATALLATAAVGRPLGDHDDRVLLEVLALRLAGARSEADRAGFGDVAVTMNRVFGWPASELLTAPAHLVDELAASVPDDNVPSTPSADGGERSGWVRYELRGGADDEDPDAAEPADALDELRDLLAGDLLRRGRSPLSRSLRTTLQQAGDATAPLDPTEPSGATEARGATEPSGTSGHTDEPPATSPKGTVTTSSGTRSETAPTTADEPRRRAPRSVHDTGEAAGFVENAVSDPQVNGAHGVGGRGDLESPATPAAVPPDPAPSPGGWPIGEVTEQAATPADDRAEPAPRSSSVQPGHSSRRVPSRTQPPLDTSPPDTHRPDVGTRSALVDSASSVAPVDELSLGTSAHLGPAARVRPTLDDLTEELAVALDDEADLRGLQRW